MGFRSVAILSLCALLPVVCGLEAKGAERRKPVRQVEIPRPVKDCHRYNGWYGFYGNIWCSPAEQRRWDLWDAARVRAAR